jgi:UDP-N-acetyl-D-mannosaminuronate dehydrogenase
LISYHDPYFPFIGKGRKYDLQMKRSELEKLGECDCVVIVTDHSNYRRIVAEAQLVVDTRNATKGVAVPKFRGATPIRLTAAECGCHTRSFLPARRAELQSRCN